MTFPWPQDIFEGGNEKKNFSLQRIGKSGGEIAKHYRLQQAKNNICHPKISKHAHVWKYESWSPTEYSKNLGQAMKYHLQ